MTERNYDTLRRALDRLPAHDAAPVNWPAIERGLAPAAPGERLPSYQPPPAVWNAINAGLTAREEAEVREAAVRPLARYRRPLDRYLAYAVALSLLVTAGIGLGNHYADQPTVTVAYSQESAPPPFTDDSELDEGSFTRAIASIEARDEPGLNSLRLELDELTAAKQEVRAMLVSYGNDPAIVRQLAEIERDRSDVYRRIIVEL